ncbi:MAG: hypothetical protein AB1546_16590 [bacterium]
MHAVGDMQEILIKNELEKKYKNYRDIYAEMHMYMGGGAVDTWFDDAHENIVGYDGYGDSQGFTGLAMAAFTLAGDWDLARKSFDYLKKCEVEPGLLYRFPNLMEKESYLNNVTSIDQYIMDFLGFAIAYKFGSEDLKKDVKDMVFRIVDYGLKHDWKMGNGPYTNIKNATVQLELMTELMGDYIDIENDMEKLSVISLVTNLSNIYNLLYDNYYNFHLFWALLLTIRLVQPDMTELDGAVEGFYKALQNDNNALFNWLYNFHKGYDVSFVVEELMRFPPTQPNMWLNSGYSDGYRWQRSPEQIKENNEKPHDSPLEYPGIDYMLLYQLWKNTDKLRSS